MNNKKNELPLGVKETKEERAKRIRETGDGRFAPKITQSKKDKLNNRNSKASKKERDYYSERD